jgi:hypothetical protein
MAAASLDARAMLAISSKSPRIGMHNAKYNLTSVFG